MATWRCSQFVRQFSSSVAKAGKLVQSPVQVYGVEGRYATALYSAASKQNKLEAVEKELTTLQVLRVFKRTSVQIIKHTVVAMAGSVLDRSDVISAYAALTVIDDKHIKGELKKDRKLLEFLYDPSQKRAYKRAAIQKLLKQKNFSELTVNLFVTLSDNGRISKTEQVLSSFGRIMSAHRGEVQSTVITAKPLDEASLNELRSALQGFLKKGQSLKLYTEVDPSLIGGMQVTIGDRYVDMSMASRIKTYTELIKQAV